MSNDTIQIPVPVPTAIINRIPTNLSVKEQEKAHQIITHIIYTSIVNRIPFMVYRPFAFKYKKMIVGDSNFYFIWRVLERAGILEVRTSPTGKKSSTKGKKCIYLRLNPVYLHGPRKYLFYVRTRAIRKPKIHPNKECTAVGNSLMMLSSKEDSKHDWRRITITRKVIEKFQTSRFKWKDGYVSVKYKKRWRNYSTKQFNIRQYQDFERICRASYVPFKLKELENGPYYATRNETNFRLDHNLTNCDGLLFEQLLLDGEEIVEFDLANSQPLLLSLVLKGVIRNNYIKTYLTSCHTPVVATTSSLLFSEIELFHELCIKGELYKYMEKKLNRGDDDTIKTEFITAMYGGMNPPWSKAQQMLEEVFPEISKFLIGFKKNMIPQFVEAKGDASHELSEYLYSKTKGVKSAEDAACDYLSVFLQRIEAEIFIDHILSTLVDYDLTVLPKHDSILCPKSQEDVVERIFRNVLSDLIGDGNYFVRRKNLSTPEPPLPKLIPFSIHNKPSYYL